MTDTYEYMMYLRSSIQAAQAAMPTTSLNVTVESLVAGKSNEVKLASASFGAVSWENTLFSAGSGSDAYPAVRTVTELETSSRIMQLDAAPLTAALAVNDAGVLSGGPLRTATIFTNSITDDGVRQTFLGSSAPTSPMAVRIRMEDSAGLYKGQSGYHRQGSATTLIRLVMLGDEDVAITNTFLISATADQLMRIILKRHKASNLQRSRVTFASNEGQSVQIGWESDMYVTADDRIDKRPVIVLDIAYGVNFM